MRIMYTNNSIPIKQNTMNFRGEEDSWLDTLDAIPQRIPPTLQQDEERTCKDIFNAASNNLLAGSEKPSDEKAFLRSGAMLIENMGVKIVQNKQDPAWPVVFLGRIDKIIERISSLAGEKPNFKEAIDALSEGLKKLTTLMELRCKPRSL